MHSELNSRDGENWAQNACNSSWFQPGKPYDLVTRANVLRLWLYSKSEKEKGRKGFTYEEISKQAGPGLTTCKVNFTTHVLPAKGTGVLCV
jgi:hypothetical protein